MDPNTRSQTATITKMEAQKKRPTRVSIYLDGSFALGMDYDLAQRLGLRTGQKISPRDLEKITLAEEKNRAKNFTLDFLGYRARSVLEVRQRLTRRGHPASIVEEVIAELKAGGLLDDEDFAARWARGRMATKPLGEKLLRRELELKGVPREIVEKTIAETFRGIRPQELAGDLLRSRAKRYQDLDPVRARRRMTDFLLRRGFDREVIREAVDQAIRDWGLKSGHRQAP
jgi:regulatory protein